MLSMSNVTKISFPKDFAHRIKRLIEKDVLPYRSVSEFVLDSSRRRVEELEDRKIKEASIEA
jgi:Arc/MetJ-type ribon-helix-helix transcriptional regulator